MAIDDAETQKNKPSRRQRFKERRVENKQRSRDAYWQRQGQRPYPQQPQPRQKNSRYYQQRGIGEYKGRIKASIQSRANPWGRAFIIAFLYAFFSIGPIPLLPALSYIWYIWGMAAIWTGTLAFSQKIPPEHRRLGPFILLLIAFLLFNIGPVLGLYAISDIYAENLGIIFTNPLDQLYSKYLFSITNFKNVRTAEEIETKGIQFKNFVAGEAFKEKEVISLSAEAVVDGILDQQTGNYEPRKIQFVCYEQTQDGSIKTRGEVVTQFGEKPGEPIDVPQQSQTTFYLTCTFKEGLTIDETNVNLINVKGSEFHPWKVKEGIEVDQLRVTPKGIVIEAGTTYTQVTSLKLYNIQEAKKREKGDLIKKIRENDKDMKSDGIVNPYCENGCGSPYKLALTTGVQPITENQRLRLKVELLKDKSVFGILRRINDMTLSIPQGVTLENEPAPCDFKGEKDVRLLEDELELVNKKIEASVNAQRADKTVVPKVRFSCHYTIPQPSETWTYKLLKGRISYDIIVRNRIPIEIYEELPLGEEANLA